MSSPWALTRPVPWHSPAYPRDHGYISIDHQAKERLDYITYLKRADSRSSRSPPWVPVSVPYDACARIPKVVSPYHRTYKGTSSYIHQSIPISRGIPIYHPQDRVVKDFQPLPLPWDRSIQEDMQMRRRRSGAPSPPPAPTISRLSTPDIEPVQTTSQFCSCCVQTKPSSTSEEYSRGRRKMDAQVQDALEYIQARRQERKQLAPS